MMKILPALATALLLTAPVLAAGNGASLPPEAVPELPASDLLLRYEGPDLHFRWSLPAEVSLEPELAQELRTEALANREKAIREAQEDAAMRAASDFPAMPHEWLEHWQEQAETDRLLAFSADRYRFTGGAHGMVELLAVIWDRSTNQRIAFAELFTDPTAMFRALQPAFCKALDEERSARRDGHLGDDFNDCLDPSSYAIVPVGEGEITGIRVLVPPYEAGPWAEGSYEITLPAGLVQPFLQAGYKTAFTRP